MRNVRFADPAEGQTGQRDSNLGGREIGVEMGQDMARLPSPGISLFYERIELAGPHLDERKLRGDEKAVQQNENQDEQDVGRDDARRIPLRRNFLRRREKEECDHGWPGNRNEPRTLGPRLVKKTSAETLTSSIWSRLESCRERPIRGR